MLSARRCQSGFTLIELMVAVTIALILVSLTAAVVATTMNSDRIRSSARQVQSSIAGARDRAIRAGRDHPGKNPLVGVRFIVDNPPLPGGVATVSSMIFIGSIILDPPTETIQIYFDSNGKTRKVVATNPGWSSFQQRGLIVVGTKIQIKNGSISSIYAVDGTVDTSSPPFEVLTLTSDYVDPSPYTYNSMGPQFQLAYPWVGSYFLQLEPAVLAGQQPMILSSGITIDLSKSANLPNYSAGFFDIMFSPRGTVAGPSSAAGLMHFFLAETKNVINPAAPVGDRKICTLFTQTGNVSAFDVAAPPLSPFYFAQNGLTAGR